MLEALSLALRFRRFLLCRQRHKRMEVLGVLAILSFFFFASVYFNDEKSHYREILSQRLAHFKWPNQIDSDGQMVSYCSLEADRRGPNQNVISYSLYGNFSDPKHFERYAEPIKFILPKIKQFYPGWIMRIYSPLEFTNEEGNKKLKEFFKDYPFVDLCNITRVMEWRNISQPIWPDSWRFLAMLDPLVDRMLSRDTDSLVLDREVVAKNQWLYQSNATFHLMHDHPEHCSSIFLGASWGVKIHQNREAIIKATEKMFYNNPHKMVYCHDQVLLNEFLWPIAINDSLHHDSYCCKKFKTSIPFPTQRIGSEYVAQYANGKSQPLPPTCPQECRPKEHPDWTRC